MPNINDLKDSKFLTKDDVGNGILVTIDHYELLDVSLENEPVKEKWCLYFKEADKPFVLNITNGNLIAAITGSEDFDDWVGKQIVLFNDVTVQFAGKVTGGIRVRASKRQQPIENDDIPF
jgi:hypothetical protein